jgi:hypothetical protein
MSKKGRKGEKEFGHSKLKKCFAFFDVSTKVRIQMQKEKAQSPEERECRRESESPGLQMRCI